MVPTGIEFALRTRRQRMNTDVHSLSCLRLICACTSYLYRLFPKGFFSQYTTHLLRRIAKSVHPCTLLAASFGSVETSLLISPAASVPLLINAQRIISAMDGGAYMQHRVCTTNSKFKNIHGRIFLNVSSLYFQLTPCICIVYFQKAFFTIYSASTSLLL